MKPGKTTLRACLLFPFLFLAGCLFGQEEKEQSAETRTYVFEENVSLRDTVYDFTYIAGLYDSNGVFPWFETGVGDSLLFTCNHDFAYPRGVYPGGHDEILVFLVPPADSLKVDSLHPARIYFMVHATVDSLNGSKRVFQADIRGLRLDAKSYHAEGRVIYSRAALRNPSRALDTLVRDTLAFSGTFKARR